MRTPWEDEFWTPDVRWRDERCFVVAGGPSVTPEIAGRLQGERTIVVNSTAALMPRASILFFTDNGWLAREAELVAGWAGEIVTLSRRARRELRDRVRRVKGETRADFPAPGSATIRQGRSSGHTAVGLAVALGATEINLVGFDMRVIAADGDIREHNHDRYRDIAHRDYDLYAREFIPAFAGWRAAALARGAVIRNCTPGSALKEFPMVDLDEVLA